MCNEYKDQTQIEPLLSLRSLYYIANLESGDNYKKMYEEVITIIDTYQKLAKLQTAT